MGKTTRPDMRQALAARRKSAFDLASAQAPPGPKPARGRKAPRSSRPAPTWGPKTTTIRFLPDQWAWLLERAQALALEHGGRADDVSRVVRELVAKAMRRDS